MTSSLSLLFERDLDKLKTEINSFRREENLWKAISGVINPAGNLSLHICGNLQHFIGATLGETGYKRDREKEFAAKNVPRSKVVREIEVTSKSVKSTLAKLEPSSLDQKYKYDFLGDDATTELALIHFYGHMHWHLGQINYLRRILES